MNHLSAALLLAAGLAASSSALAQSAQSAQSMGFYVGGGFGQSQADIDNAAFNAAARGIPGVTGASTTSDERDTGWKFFAGYQFHPNFAAEFGYAYLGKFGVTSALLPAGVLTGEAKVENNWSGDLLGILPLGNFSVFGRLGLLWSETKVTLTGVGPGGAAAINTKDDDLSWKMGVGAGYEFTRQLGMRGEWERYRVSDGVGGRADVDLLSVSLRFKF